MGHGGAMAQPSQLSGEQHGWRLPAHWPISPPLFWQTSQQPPDSANGALSVIRILNQMAQQFNTAIIVVTHDENHPDLQAHYHIRDGANV